MPKFDYNKSFLLAKKLLEKFGGAGDVVVANMTTPDDTEPWNRTNSPIVHGVTMVIVPLKRIFDRGMNFGISLPEDVTRATHKALILWNQDADILPDQKLVYQGKTWMIGSASPIKPFDTGVIWIADVWGAV